MGVLTRNSDHQYFPTWYSWCGVMYLPSHRTTVGLWVEWMCLGASFINRRFRIAKICPLPPNFGTLVDWATKVRKCNWLQSYKALQLTNLGGSKFFMGAHSQIEDEWSSYWESDNFWGGWNVSLLWGHYQLRVALKHFVKSIKTSWHGSDPSQFW